MEAASNAPEALRSIYVIRSEQGSVKVGISNDPRKRLDGLQTAHPYTLHLDYAATVAGDCEQLEATEHALLKRYRLSGEWFNVSSEDAKGAVIAAASELEISLHAADTSTARRDRKRVIARDIIVLADLPASPQERLVERALEAERDRIRERIATVKQDQKSRGRYLGGKVPFGFRVEDGALVEVAEEQAIIAAALALRTDAKPLCTIQAALTEQHGRKLSLDSLSRILNEPA